MTTWRSWVAITPVLWSYALWSSVLWSTSGALAAAQAPPSRLAAAIGQYDRRQYAEAIRLLNAARQPKLADYSAYYLAAAKIETEDYAGARKDLASLEAFTPASPFGARGRLLEGRALLKAGDAAAAIRELREYYGELPQPGGDALLGEAYEAAGDLPHAASFQQRVYYYFPASDEAVSAATALARLETRMGDAYPPPMAPLMFSRVEKLIAARRYSDARKDLETLTAELGGEDRERARVKTGAVEYTMKEYRAAARYLENLEIKSPEPDAERLYYLAECGRHLDDDPMTDRSLKGLEKYPRSPWRLKALTSAANKFLVSNQPERYEPLYRACAENFPDEPEAATCDWKVVWAAYMQRRRNVTDKLRDHVTRFPASPNASAALYYLGRQAEAARDSAGAAAYYTRLVERYPAFYYGLLAAERMRQVALARATPSPQVSAFLNSLAIPPRRFPEDHTPSAATKTRIERARLLSQAGLDSLAEAELRFGAKTDAQPHLMAVELARMAPSPAQGLRHMKSLVSDYFAVPVDAAPKSLWEPLFPLPYRSELVKATTLTDLDPSIVAGLIRQESEFNPKAVSRMKAMGLTQVRPVTGRELARRAGIAKFSTAMLFQPSVNLRLGTMMLRRSLDRWGGKWEQTLAAYNAGPARAESWSTWGDFQEQSEFVETIPFTETREYVQSVLRNAARYRALYGDKLAAEAAQASKAATEVKVRQTAPKPHARKRSKT